MKIGKSLLAKLGLFAPKSEIVDAFSMRLERISMRESRRQVRQALFRGFAQSQAA
jgi:hypothetical protein